MSPLSGHNKYFKYPPMSIRKLSMKPLKTDHPNARGPDMHASAAVYVVIVLLPRRSLEKQSTLWSHLSQGHLTCVGPFPLEARYRIADQFLVATTGGTS